MSTAFLHPRLRDDLGKLASAEASILLAGAVLLALVPDGLIRFVGLEGATATGLRAVAVLWFVLGAALAVTIRRPLCTRGLAALVGAHGLLAAFLVAAPFAFGITVSARGWFLSLALVLFLAGAGTAWMLTLDRLRVAERGRATHVPAAPSSVDPSISAR